MKGNFSILACIIISISLLSGCQNTAAGFGEDMQANGKAIQKKMNEK